MNPKDPPKGLNLNQSSTSGKPLQFHKKPSQGNSYREICQPLEHNSKQLYTPRDNQISRAFGVATTPTQNKIRTSILSPTSNRSAQGAHSLSPVDRSKIHFIYHSPRMIRESQKFKKSLKNNERVLIEKIWEKCFVRIYSRFQVFVQKFEIVFKQLSRVEEQFDQVNDEESWSELRQNYEATVYNCSIIREQIIEVLEENKKNLDKISPEVLKSLVPENERQKSEQKNLHESERIKTNDHDLSQKIMKAIDEHSWQIRYKQLYLEYENVIAEAQKIKEALDDHSENKMKREFENRYKILENQNQELKEHLQQLEIEYDKAVTHIQSQQNTGPAQTIHHLEVQLKQSQERIEYLQRNVHSNNQNGQITKLYAELEQINQHRNILINNLNEMEEQLKNYQKQLQEKQYVLHEQQKTIFQLEKSVGMSSLRLENEVKSNYSNGAVERLEVQLEEYREAIEERERIIEDRQKMIEERERIIEEYSTNNNLMGEENSNLKCEIKRIEIHYQEKNIECQRLEKRITNLLEENKEISQGRGRSNTFLELERNNIEKDRKIKTISSELEELGEQLLKKSHTKQKIISEITEFFSQQTEREKKKLKQRDNKIKHLQQKISIMEIQINNKNQQILKLKQCLKVQFPTRSYQRKNVGHDSEVKQIRKSLEVKILSHKDLQQKYLTLRDEMNSKIFENQQLKRYELDFNCLKQELNELNGIVKKKNQELNDYKVISIEKDEMVINLSSEKRQKIKLAEHNRILLKEIEKKDQQINNLNKKIHSAMSDKKISSNVSTTKTSSKLEETQILRTQIRQKQSQIKRLIRNVQVLENNTVSFQKINRELNAEINKQKKLYVSLQSSTSKEIDRLQQEKNAIENFLRREKKLNEEKQNNMKSLKQRINILEKECSDIRKKMERESENQRQKAKVLEEKNKDLMIELQILKGQNGNLNNEKQLKMRKIKQMQEKFELKNKMVEDLRQDFEKKYKDGLKDSEQKVKQLDADIKLKSAKFEKMEKQISTLNQKLKISEEERKSYKSKLFTEIQDKNHQITMQHILSTHSVKQQRWPDSYNRQIFDTQISKLKDHKSNHIFENKVIYQLKKQNELLRQQILSIGIPSLALNRIEATHQKLSQYQKQLKTERSRHDSNFDMIESQKKKSQGLQERLIELIRINKQLKDRVSHQSANSTNILSIQFYKEQITKLEKQVDEQKSKIESLSTENYSIKEDLVEYENEYEELKAIKREEEKKIEELNEKINNVEKERLKHESEKTILKSEIERFKKQLIKEKQENKELLNKEKILSEWKKKCQRKDEEIVKLNNRLELMSAETQRLKQIVKKNKKELLVREQKEEELRKKIYILETDIQAMRFREEHSLSSYS